MTDSLTRQIKRVLLITIKSGVNALLTTGAVVIAFHDTISFYSNATIRHLAFIAGGAIFAREVVVWLPRIMAWTESPTNGVVVVIDPNNPPMKGT